MMDTAGVEHMPYHDKAFSSFLQAQSNLGLPPSSTPPHFFDPADLPPQLYLHACSLEFVLMLSSFRTLSTARNSYRYLSPESMASLAYPSAECFSIASAFRSNSPLTPCFSPLGFYPTSIAMRQPPTSTSRTRCALHASSTSTRPSGPTATSHSEQTRTCPTSIPKPSRTTSTVPATSKA
jgi:hypothetical protein